MKIDSTTVFYPPKLWRILGDEYLVEFNFMSRTAAPDWGYLPVTPCIFRFSPKPEKEPTLYRVNVSSLEQQHIRINNYDGEGYRRCANYLFAGNTCYFNGNTYPNMMYGFQANNLLKEIGWAMMDNEMFLKFETVTPEQDVSTLSYSSQPWLIHQWDLISGTDRESTKHTPLTPRGKVYNFLVSKEGYGFIPKKNVEPFS